MDIFKTFNLSCYCCRTCNDKERDEIHVTVIPERGHLPVAEDEVPPMSGVAVVQQAAAPVEPTPVLTLGSSKETPRPPTEADLRNDEQEATDELAPKDVSKGGSEEKAAEPAQKEASRGRRKEAAAAQKAEVASTDGSRASSGPSAAGPKAAPKKKTTKEGDQKKKAKAKASGTTGEPLGKSAKLVKEADELFKRKSMEEALAKYTEALEQDPHCVGAYVGRGVCKLRMEAWSEAKSDLTKALEIDPTNMLALRERAEVNLALNEHDLAILDFDAKLRLAPADGKALCGRGDAKLRKGDKEGAAADLSIAANMGYPGAQELLKKTQR